MYSWKSASGSIEVSYLNLLYAENDTLTLAYGFGTAFGFAAALLESIPIIGLAFSVCNRVGAAMWAHGQSLKAKYIPSPIYYLRIRP